MKKLLPPLLLLAQIALAQAPQVELQTGFAQELLAENLNPTCMVFDQHGNLFLGQKDGRVLLLDHDGQLLPDPVLTLAVDDFNERGLVGLALHPDFDQHPWLYVFYTAQGENANRVSRFRLNGYFAVPGSEQILFEFDEMPGTVHNGGGMVFDAAGDLFVGHGDGGKSSNAQKLDITLGKIIRLHDDGSIPADNPFFDTATGKNRAIFCYGIRNPFGMSFQKSTKKIFFNDVGAGAFEEVNEVERSKNYGWNKVEGPLQAGVVPPENYREPTFAYPHSEGCAIVGSAIYQSENQQFPSVFSEKYFFADYCKGFIKTLDLETSYFDSLFFATGLKQPVAFSVHPEDGSLFYLMRSGIGGGSVVDNTASTDGTLWRVFFNGSGAPVISLSPRDVLVSEGESAQFAVQALGTPPFHFFWEKNGIPLPNMSHQVIEIQDLTLADSGSIFRCIVENASGRDTSETAILSVTSNRRPLPEITFPLPGSRFRAGDTLRFEGLANDPEQGVLPVSSLLWKVDFHHDTHAHPVLAGSTGIASGSLVVPLAGEVSENVWFRIHLTATDSRGMSRSVFRDVLPDLTTVQVESNAPLAVNVDGLVRPMPFSFLSLKNQTRTLEVPALAEKNDSVFIFKNWQNTGNQPLLSFQTPDTTTTFLAEYDIFKRGIGVGLHGEYFLDPEFDLDGLPIFLRQDTVINFNWGDDSPHPTLPGNGFTVRWSGYVQPVFSEKYTFYLKSDDGSRLWIGDSLVIDKWVPQPPTETAGSLTLVGGKKYPIRLEYLEIAGGSEISFWWSSAHTPKELVPKKQLYLPDPLAPAAVRGKVWDDKNYNRVFDPGEAMLSDVAAMLFRLSDSTLLETQLTDNQGKYKFSELKPGGYFLRFLPAQTNAALTPFFNLNALGATDSIRLAPLQSLVFDVAFALPPSSFSGTCWHDQNADDKQQLSEPPLENVSVLLLDASDTTLLDVRLTDVEGQFSFDFLPGGAYFLQFVNAFGNPNLLPGGAVSGSGESGLLALPQGENRQFDVPFLDASAEIEGKIWLDKNLNHFPDLDETGIGQVSALLFRADSSLVFARSTDVQGRFSMLPLPAGQYFFQFSAALAGPDLLPGTGLSALGFSPMFALASGEKTQFRFSFVPKTSGVETGAESSSFSIFPNPNDGKFWLQGVGNQDVAVFLTNTLGEKLPLLFFKENDLLRVETSGLPGGVYFLTVEKNGRRETVLVVVEG